jgi:hypothetical protein
MITLQGIGISLKLELSIANTYITIANRLSSNRRIMPIDRILYFDNVWLSQRAHTLDMVPLVI